MKCIFFISVALLFLFTNEFQLDFQNLRNLAKNLQGKNNNDNFSSKLDYLEKKENNFLKQNFWMTNLINPRFHESVVNSSKQNVNETVDLGSEKDFSNLDDNFNQILSLMRNSSKIAFNGILNGEEKNRTAKYNNFLIKVLKE